jgi:hypothetical protein
VHLTGGILRHFRAFSTPEQNPALEVLSTPAHPQVTQAVGWLTCKRKESFGQPSETAGEVMETNAQGFGELPDMESCRAKKVTDDFELVDCLIEHPLCEFALAFGYGYFCRHPRRKEIAERTKTMLKNSGTTIQQNTWAHQAGLQSAK